jgi:hypothetical protein
VAASDKTGKFELLAGGSKENRLSDIPAKDLGEVLQQDRRLCRSGD